MGVSGDGKVGVVVEGTASTGVCGLSRRVASAVAFCWGEGCGALSQRCLAPTPSSNRVFTCPPACNFIRLYFNHANTTLPPHHLS